MGEGGRTILTLVIASWGGAEVGEPAWWYQWVQAARRYSATEDGGDGQRIAGGPWRQGPKAPNAW